MVKSKTKTKGNLTKFADFYGKGPVTLEFWQEWIVIT